MKRTMPETRAVHVTPPVTRKSVAMIGGSDVASSSLYDQANLLLSIAGIAKTELSTHPSALTEDTDVLFPSFPHLQRHQQTHHIKHKPLIKPRPNSLQNFLKTHKLRLRSVSMDAAESLRHEETRSPRFDSGAVTPTQENNEQTLPTTPPTPPTRIHRSARLSKLARREHQHAKSNNKTSLIYTNKNNSSLQSQPPDGVPITTIMRRKFSWKNYPELEQFLVANRQEYLRHSALNYTLQQKQYNNRLTEQLLELATEHGYIFDARDFSFVTVRDRIRCYYKSFVQSAKKRGILMGYAARKAGLLKEAELDLGKPAKIVIPES